MLSRNNDNALISEDEGINFKKLYNFINRNRKVIISLTSFSILLGGFNAFFGQKIWKGEIQIVLRKNENALMNNVQSQEDLANLAVMNLTGQDTGLRTEVEILKSPSILKPIFEFVNRFVIEKLI